MYTIRKTLTLTKILFFSLFIALTAVIYIASAIGHVSAMPFYDLKPSEIQLRSKFFTSYPTSTDERKCNIKLASKSLDNVLVAPNEEFSFNLTVGERTTTRGYKQAKIIVGGEFVDGVGGGVCQVSTTLYNAVILAGLEVTEYHPHSLPVSYVAPSFDAMVNSGFADLKFINNTHNPIIIKTIADGSVLTVEIYGEKLEDKLSRKSVTVSEIPAPDYEILSDDNLEYSDLYEGESRIIKYAKNGYKSEGYIVRVTKDNRVLTKKLRSDTYAPVKGKIILGKAVRDISEEISDNDETATTNYHKLAVKIKNIPQNLRKILQT